MHTMTRFWPRLAALALLALSLSMPVKAAGEWEWVEGQGWSIGAGVARPTAREQLAYAYQLEQRSEYMDAARQYFLLIRNFPDTQEAGVGLQRLAKCLFEMENYFTSYQAIEQVIRTYPKTGRMSDLVEIELRIAKKMLTSKGTDSLLDPSGKPEVAKLHNVLKVVDSVIDHDPYGPTAPEAYLAKGEALLMLGNINEARAAFETIRDEFPKSEFLERARLGILRCDSLVGQARPQEVAEQIQTVRDAEAERAKNRVPGEDEEDSVEQSILQGEETEAGKMMEQAEQYRRMGQRKSVQAAEFLYKEVVRRYPRTSHAELARERLGNIKVPKQDSKVGSAIRNVKLNPFKRDKENPPWIVPQLNDEAVVIDQGAIGPIAGVPETDLPAGHGVGIRPAASSAGRPAASSAPVDDFMPPPAGGEAMPFDAPPPMRQTASAPMAPIDPMGSGQYAVPPSAPVGYGEPAYQAQPPVYVTQQTGQAPMPNFPDLGPSVTIPATAAMSDPILPIPESDMVDTRSSSSYPSAQPQVQSATYPAPAYNQQPAAMEPVYQTPAQSVQQPIYSTPNPATTGYGDAPMPDMAPTRAYSQQSAALVMPIDNQAMTSDLIGPRRRESAPAVSNSWPQQQSQPAADYGFGAPDATMAPQPVYSEPVISQPTYVQQQPVVSQPVTTYPAPANDSGWFLSDDFQ